MKIPSYHKRSIYDTFVSKTSRLYLFGANRVFSTTTIGALPVCQSQYHHDTFHPLNCEKIFHPPLFSRALQHWSREWGNKPLDDNTIKSAPAGFPSQLTNEALRHFGMDHAHKTTLSGSPGRCPPYIVLMALCPRPHTLQQICRALVLPLLQES